MDEVRERREEKRVNDVSLQSLPTTFTIYITRKNTGKILLNDFVKTIRERGKKKVDKNPGSRSELIVTSKCFRVGSIESCHSSQTWTSKTQRL